MGEDVIRSPREHAHNQAVAAKVAKLMEKGVDQRVIAARLNDAGDLTCRGKRWTDGGVSNFIAKYIDAALKEKYATTRLQARGGRRREFRSGFAAEFADLSAQGVPLVEVARRMNAAGRWNSAGNPWNEVTVSRVIKEGRGSGTRELKRDHELSLVPEVTAMIEAGLSQGEIADRLNGMQHLTNRGKPWQQSSVSKFIARLIDPAVREKHSAAGYARGCEGRARAVDQHADTVWPAIAKMLEEGLPQSSITDRLNADGFRDRGGELWTHRQIVTMVRRRLGDEAYAQVSARGLKHGGASVKLAAGRHNEQFLPIILALRAAGLTRAQICDRLNGEGHRNSVGTPWSVDGIAKLLLTHSDKATQGTDRRARTAARVAARHAAERAHNEKAVARVAELKQAGFSQRQVLDQLNKNGRNSAGRPWTIVGVNALMRRYKGGAAIGSPPLILGKPGEPAQVLGVDGKYREKAFGDGSRGKTRWKVVEAVLLAGPSGLTSAQLQKITGGARGVLASLVGDPDWAAIIYPPDKGQGIGWRIGPPRPIDA